LFFLKELVKKYGDVNKDGLQAEQTHLNPNTGGTLHDGVFLFPTD
jgi:hypothetical protein